ncbi:MAG TPA: aldo/keto reductase [Chthoniobacteraceae bacterium]|nr:aldo/keto reductase [Chthoniobacteraceae bacterium]
MNTTHLGRSGLRVSRLCLGTMNFGPQATPEESFAIMDRALEAGINFLDTADVYGWRTGEGYTETIVGDWFAQGGGRREKIVLATKVYGNMQPEAVRDPNLAPGLSARKIIRQCEASLRRLRTDWIDLYQMHHIDRSCPFEEIWQAMETLVAQGKVLYVGSSNFAGWDIATAQLTARQRHFVGLVSEQSLYNLAERSVELEVIPAARHHGLGLLPWSPLGRGLLAGPPAAKGRRHDQERIAERTERKEQVEAYEALCRELGRAPSTIALAWLLHQPAVTAPIIGPRTLDQLQGNLEALDCALDEATLRRLDEIWPPTGSAPEAYAW